MLVQHKTQAKPDIEATLQQTPVSVPANKAAAYLAALRSAGHDHRQQLISGALSVTHNWSRPSMRLSIPEPVCVPTSFHFSDDHLLIELRHALDQDVTFIRDESVVLRQDRHEFGMNARDVRDHLDYLLKSTLMGVCCRAMINTDSFKQAFVTGKRQTLKEDLWQAGQEPLSQFNQSSLSPRLDGTLYRECASPGWHFQRLYEDFGFFAGTPFGLPVELDAIRRRGYVPSGNSEAGLLRTSYTKLVEGLDVYTSEAFKKWWNEFLDSGANIAPNELGFNNQHEFGLFTHVRSSNGDHSELKTAARTLSKFAGTYQGEFSKFVFNEDDFFKLAIQNGGKIDEEAARAAHDEAVVEAQKHCSDVHLLSGYNFAKGLARGSSEMRAQLKTYLLRGYSRPRSILNWLSESLGKDLIRFDSDVSPSTPDVLDRLICGWNAQLRHGSGCTQVRCGSYADSNTTSQIDRGSASEYDMVNGTAVRVGGAVLSETLLGDLDAAVADLG